MITCLSFQLRGFFKGMAFPVMTTGLANSVVFGSYSNALDYLTQSQRSDRSQGKPATAAQIFTAGCFSGLVQVRTPDVHWLVSSKSRCRIIGADITGMMTVRALKDNTCFETDHSQGVKPLHSQREQQIICSFL